MPNTDFVKEITPDVELITPNKKQAIEEFIQLMNIPGWQRARNIINEKVKKYEEEILNTEVQGEDLNRLRDRRDLCLWFTNLPEILIEVMREEQAGGGEPEFDPYDVPGVPQPPQQIVDNTTEIG